MFSSWFLLSISLISLYSSNEYKYEWTVDRDSTGSFNLFLWQEVGWSSIQWNQTPRSNRRSLTKRSPSTGKTVSSSILDSSPWTRRDYRHDGLCNRSSIRISCKYHGMLGRQVTSRNSLKSERVLFHGIRAHVWTASGERLLPFDQRG
jgi:hypothetical protein